MPAVCTNQTNHCFSANSVDELLVVYTADAHEWAKYLRHILKSTRKLHKASVVLYAISPADQLQGYNFEYFQSYSCVLVLVSGELLDTLQLNLELRAALQKLFYPPHRVVALLCGVSQDDVLQDVFPDWPRWRKVSAEDEPTVYISATLESVTESMQELIRRHRTRWLGSFTGVASSYFQFLYVLMPKRCLMWSTHTSFNTSGSLCDIYTG